MENTCPCCALGSLLWDVRAAEAWHLPHPPVAPVSPPAPEPKDPAGKRPSLLLSICLPCAYKADPTWMSAPPRYHNPPPPTINPGSFRAQHTKLLLPVLSPRKGEEGKDRASKRQGPKGLQTNQEYSENHSFGGRVQTLSTLKGGGPLPIRGDHSVSNELQLATGRRA